LLRFRGEGASIDSGVVRTGDKYSIATPRQNEVAYQLSNDPKMWASLAPLV